MTRPQGKGVGIVGMGAHLPDQIRTNDAWDDEFLERYEARMLRDLTGTVDKAAAEADDVDPEVAKWAGPYFMDPFRGTKQRRMLGENSFPSDMEVAACQAAIADAGMSAADIDGLLGHSTIRDNIGVSNHGLVADRLGLPRNIVSFEVSAGCASFLPLLRLAAQHVLLGECEHVLVYVSSAVSRVTDYTRPSSVLGGDGAIALVVGRVEPGYGYIDQANTLRGEFNKALQLYYGGDTSVPWYRGDLSDHPLTVQRGDARAVHQMGVRSASVCRETCELVFDKTGYGPDDVDFFVLSQATAWFGRAFADALGLPHDKILMPDEHFERFGHLMAASSALNLYLAAKEHRRLDKGDLVLIFSPGIGFNASASLYRWNLPR